MKTSSEELMYVITFHILLERKITIGMIKKTNEYKYTIFLTGKKMNINTPFS